MANYSYLTVCSSDVFPEPAETNEEADGDWSPYPPSAEAGPMYEAKYCIPLFWLCLFEEKHLRTVSASGILAEEDDRVPALFAPHDEAVRNLSRRRPLLAQVLAGPELDLFDAFAARVEKEYRPFLLVDAEEVALMSGEGECAGEIADTLRIIDTLPPGEWTNHFAFINVAGLDEGKPIGNPGWYTLVGYDNTSLWPDEPEESVKKRQDAAVSPEIATLHEKAGAGDADAQYALGQALFRGEGVRRNDVLAWSWFLKAADQGHAEAQYMAGCMHSEGVGIPQSYEAGVKWLRKAAEQGHARAQNSLGFHYERGYGLDADLHQAMQWYAKAAEQGLVQGQYNLGVSYVYRDGAKNEAEGFRWLLKAAEQGDGDAVMHLGRMCKDGTGTEPDAAAAFGWFLKEAENGRAGAQYEVGYAYDAGEGVGKNPEKAVYWYSKAVGQDHPAAMYNLAIIYGYGQGVAEDIPAANRLLLRLEEMDPSRREKSRDLRARLERRSAAKAVKEESQAASPEKARAEVAEPVEPDGEQTDGGNSKAGMEAVIAAAVSAERPLVPVADRFVLPPPKGSGPLLLFFTLVPPVVAGWLYSWWWVLALPLSLFAALIIIGMIKGNFRIDLADRTLRWGKVTLPFSELDAKAFRIETEGGKEAVRYCPPQGKPAVLAIFAGTDARESAEKYRTALLRLLGIRPGSGEEPVDDSDPEN